MAGRPWRDWPPSEGKIGAAALGFVTLLAGVALFAACSRSSPPTAGDSGPEGGKPEAIVTSGPGGPSRDLPEEELSVGETVERILEGAEPSRHRFYLRIPPNSYAEILFEQDGADVEPFLEPAVGDAGATEAVGLSFDSPTGVRGTERIPLISGEDGAEFHFTAEVPEPLHCQPATGRSFRVRVLEAVPVTEALRFRTLAAHRFAQSRVPGLEAEEVLRLCREAADLGRRAGDPLGEARALERQASTLYGLKRNAEAGELYQEVKRLAEDRDTALWMKSQSGLASIAIREGRYEDALTLLRRVRGREGSATEPRGLAILAGALNNEGRVLSLLGRYREAVEAYSGALEAFQKFCNPRSEVTVLGNLGRLYLRLGDGRRAFSVHRRRLDLAEKSPGLVNTALVRLSMGEALVWERDESALAHLEAAETELRRQLDEGTRRVSARLGRALLLQGYFHQRGGRPDLAAPRYAEALEVFLEAGAEMDRAAVLITLGKLHQEEGRWRAAYEALDDAEEIYRRRDAYSPPLVASVAYVRASTLDGEGKPRRALEEIEAALEIVEDLRFRAPERLLGASVGGFRYDYYGLAVDILLTLAAEDPSGGHGELALEWVERSRGRSLAEALREPGRRPAVSDPSLEALAADLWRQVRATQTHLADSSSEGVEGELAVLLERYRLISAQLSPETRTMPDLEGGRSGTSLLRVSQMQALLAPVGGADEEETRILFFLLGEERSHLWVMAREWVRHHELAPKAEIDFLVREAHEMAQGSDYPPTRASFEHYAEKLGELLLGEALADLDGAERLVVLGDGSLNYLPFAALADPRSGEPLVRRFRFVHAPSVSVLAALRGRRGTPPQGGVFLVADPVFSPSDPRLAAEDPGSPAQRRAPGSPDGLDALGPRPFERLPHTRDEREALEKHVAAGQLRVLEGFEARLVGIDGAQLRDFRILHFATHSWVDASNPELSSLVLSLVDAGGQPVDGFLRAHDIYRWRLSADLVVLSACETALGRNLRGEGFVGLPRAFFQAGARRVLVSLWSVNDKATARFMDFFYEELLQKRRAPDVALREAQLRMLDETSWTSPYYWSPFILQGDWAE